MAKKRNMSIDRAAINADIRSRFGDTVTRAQLFEYRDETGVYAFWIRRDPACRVRRGLYRVPGAGDFPASSVVTPVVKRERVKRVKREVPVPAPVEHPAPVASAPDDVPSAPNLMTREYLMAASIEDRMAAIREQASMLATVPKRAPEFVAFGDFDMIRQVIASRKFFPIFITGLSGNGKTFGINQACAMERREYVRVNITPDTDEDDLIGGFRLVDGNTVFELGPVVVAMIRGAVLLVDEIDYASPKISCIQSVLEGNAITIKKLGITVTPADGFTVFATANTKGRGDLDGRFAGANVLNEAFLERFPITVEQEYPTPAIEKKILLKTFEAEGFTVTPHAVTFFDTLTRWAEAIRATFAEGGVEDVISTRRLVHIVKAYGLFGATAGADEKALSYCVNRFETRTKDAFIDLYNKLAPDAPAATVVPAENA